MNVVKYTFQARKTRVCHFVGLKQLRFNLKKRKISFWEKLFENLLTDSAQKEKKKRGDVLN